MKFALASLLALGATAVFAQDNDNDNDNNQSLCDKYTTAALKNNTSENQLALLTVLVNTVVIGSYSPLAKPDAKVPGILANATVDGKDVSLMPYFDGTFVSTNRDGKAVSVNFLDGGGAAPLKNNTPADADKQNSNQYRLLTHLYQAFGALLGCSKMGDGQAFPSYQGDISMSRVHRFMGLNEAENTYFIQQVGAAAASFGVSDDDVKTVGGLLTNLFNYKCLAPAPLVPNTQLPAASQSICIDDSCPVAPENPNCAQSDVSFPANGTQPAVVGGGNGGSNNNNNNNNNNGGGNHDDGAFRLVDTAAAVVLGAGAVLAAALL